MSKQAPLEVGAPPEGAHRPRIVVADDDREMRETVADAMQVAGYEVTTLHDGRELFDYVVALVEGKIPVPPAVVVSDIRMPGITGLEVLRALRNAHLEIPVILMTGFGDPDVHSQAATLNAALVLDKPFPIERLKEAVASLSRRST